MVSLSDYKVYKPGLPEEDEYVIARVIRIESHGVYVRLLEYNVEAYIPIHEVSSGWVSNIRSHVKMDQVLVVKVQRVDREKGLVDASIKRVERVMARKKMRMWREENDAARTLAVVCIRHNISPKEYEEIAKKLILQFGSLADFMYTLVMSGVTPEMKEMVPNEILDELRKEAMERIRVRKVTVSAVVEVSFPRDPEGVKKVKEVLLEWKKENIPRDIDVEVYLIGSPKYRVDISAEEAKTAKGYLQRIIQRMEKRAKELNGTFTFAYLKKKKK